MMYILIVGAYVASFGLFLLIMLFGESPTFEGTIIESAHYFITVRSCEIIQKCVERICGRRAAGLCSNACDTFVNKPNPVLQIFYLGLLAGGWLLFATVALPLIPGPYVSSVHRYTAPLAVLGCLATFLLTSFCDPGVLTNVNLPEHLRAFQIDNQIYEEKECATCHLQRPARSKHCSVCNRCVARFDHHCGWMNNCIGEKNIRYFVGFLIGHTLMCWYGTYLIAQILRGEVDRRQLLSFVRGEGFLRRDAGWWDVTALLLQWLLTYFSNLVMLGAFTLVISFLLASFAAYHVHLIYKNTTTNETFKWAGYRRWLYEEALAKAVTENHKKTKRNLQTAAGELPSRNSEGGNNEKEGQVGTGFVRKGRRNLFGSAKRWLLWERRQPHIRIDVPQVRNIYDHGLLENFQEVLIPRSTRTSFKAD